MVDTEGFPVEVLFHQRMTYVVYYRIRSRNQNEKTNYLFEKHVLRCSSTKHNLISYSA